MEVTEVKHISKSVCNRTQVHKALQRYNICLTDSDHDFTPRRIKRRDKIEYERNMIVDETYE